MLVDEILPLARRSLARVEPGDSRRYVALIAARLGSLASVADGLAPARDLAPTPVERRLARRVAAAIEGEWDDGDENLVRGWLDRRRTAGEEPGPAAARALLAAARALVQIRPRPATVRFFLWEMESILAGLAEPAPLSAPAVPLLESRPPRTAHSPREEAMPKRILVVDDDENILSLERTILEQKGFAVTTAGGGEEALRLLKQESFDLVLLDVMMPDKDGFEVCRQIKQDARTRSLPVIFLTAKGGGDALAEGFEAGAVMYINKPFTANKLLTIVKTMLEQASE
ncbi:MAG: response regulator [Betaproteobacteria bacterium]